MTDQDLFNVIVDICKKVDFNQHNVRQNIWESIFDKILGFSVAGGDIRKVIVPNPLDINSVDVEFLVAKNDSISFRVGFCNTINIAQEQEKFVHMLKTQSIHIGVLISYSVLIYVWDINMRSFVVIEIELNKDNKKGAWWVHNFKKSNFDRMAIINHIQHNDKATVEKKENLIDLQQFCQSVTPHLLQQLLLQHFKKVLTDEQANTICKGVDIQVNLAPLSTATVPQYSTPVSQVQETCNSPQPTFVQTNVVPPPQYGIVVQSDVSEQAHQFRTIATNAQVNVLSPNVQRPMPPATNLIVPDIDRTKAIRLVRESKLGLGSNISFLLENKQVNKYVAKIPLDYLKADWCLILNDSVKKKISVFFIPGKALNTKMLYTVDKRNFNIQIKCRDLAYQDELSRFRFDRFLVKDIAYD